MSADSLDQLKADILATDRAAVDTKVDDKAEEFLRACVRFAKLMQKSGDPWAGITHLVNATIWITSASADFDREIEEARRVKGIGIE